jgi:GMP synthase (glutamine-hydrolysing)
MIKIVDFGSQTAHMIGRRLREIGVDYEYVYPEDLNLEDLEGVDGIILSGGPNSVYDDNSPSIAKEIFNKDIPILGICYGLQTIAHQLDGKVESGSKEYGPEKIHIENKSKIVGPIFDKNEVWMSHGDSVMKLPEGFVTVASTEKVENAIVADEERKIYGLQFHPEVSHTQGGIDILRNFVVNICKSDVQKVILDPQGLIENLNEKIGNDKVIFAVSGGVDSTVAASLVGKAIGENLIPVYVQSGLMRKGTLKRVKYIFEELIPSDLKIVNAKKRFMTSLKGVTDPEKKRKIIGNLYVQLFAEEAKKHGEVRFLGQGTIYSDVIESKGSKTASNIKSHHNVGGLPKELEFDLIEPIRKYYKDEVREIGRRLGLPEDVVMQQPFPGPGYAVRIRGEVTEKRLSQVKISDEIVLDEIHKSGIYKEVFQCFSIMTGAYSTAVKGDGRAFDEVVALRAYESKDIMTASWYRFDYDILQRISSRIVNEVPDVSRVVYDITTKPPATMEWE